MSRIDDKFAELKRDNRAGLVTYVMGGDPDYGTSMAILKGLPKAGVDLIELGMMFSDPMADGPAIQAAALRAQKAGATLKRTLDMLSEFRRGDTKTPVILMGYYNPIYRYGAEKFAEDAKAAGADGLIIVDLPPEEDHELMQFAGKAGLSIVRMATPTTDDKRLPTVLNGASGFLYYVAVAGVTGTKSAAASTIEENLTRIRRSTKLPIAVGFGIKTPQQAADVARVADAAVVGSALVELIGSSGDVVRSALRFVEGLANAVHSARRTMKVEA